MNSTVIYFLLHKPEQKYIQRDRDREIKSQRDIECKLSYKHSLIHNT